jgi:hypothetical protein
MAGEWVLAAREQLLRLRDPREAGWGYRAGAAPAVEPSVLACLGLLATDPEAGRSLRIARETAAWLTAVQNRDGSLGVSGHLPEPGWPTPYAVLLWSVLKGHRAEGERALRWLVSERAETSPRGSNSLVRHDSSLAGWPWVAETHPWVEPTALAVLALRRAGFSEPSRAQVGLRLLRDRALPAGGWNYGNTTVLDSELRAQPAPTGLALLALADGTGPNEVVTRSVAYLRRTLPGVRSALSLGWGLLGLRAWEPPPAEADAWLAETACRTRTRPDAAPRLGYLLLASGAHGPELLLGGRSHD